jgi:hypothetical protein
VVRAALNLGEHDYEVANLFATWLHQLYPGRTDDDYWGGVEADEVAELLLRLRPEQCPTVAGVLGEVGKAQRDRALRTLAGSRGDNPPLGDAVRAVLRARPTPRPRGTTCAPCSTSWPAGSGSLRSTPSPTSRRW